MTEEIHLLFAPRTQHERAQKFPGAQHRFWLTEIGKPGDTCTLNQVLELINRYDGGGSPIHAQIASGQIYAESSDPGAIGYPEVMVSFIENELGCV